MALRASALHPTGVGSVSEAILTGSHIKLAKSFGEFDGRGSPRKEIAPHRVALAVVSATSPPAAGRWRTTLLRGVAIMTLKKVLFALSLVSTFAIGCTAETVDPEDDVSSEESQELSAA